MILSPNEYCPFCNTNADENAVCKCPIEDAEAEVTSALKHPFFSEEFQITDAKTCDEVLAAILLAQSDVASVDRLPTVIYAKAILENAEKVKAHKQRKVDYLIGRFQGQLAAFARTQFKGKSKTYRTTLGAVSLTQPATQIVMADESKLNAWVRKMFPIYLVNETKEVFKWGEFKKDKQAEIHAMNPADRTAAGLDVVTPPETTKITTGVAL